MAGLLRKLSIASCNLVQAKRVIICKSKLSCAFMHNSSYLLGVKGTEIKMPSLSPTMTDGTIVSWLKKEGDQISPGDAICEVQTDKAVVAFEMEEEGILAKILVPSETKDIKIGTLIALMVEEGQDWKDVDIPTSSPSGSVDIIVQDKETAEKPKKQASHSSQNRILGPAVRTLLQSYGLRADNIQPTGPHKALLKGDVLSHIQSKGLKPTSQDNPQTAKKIQSVQSQSKQVYQDIPNTNMRKTIAKRLTESKTTIPHGYMNVESNLGKILQLRKQMAAANVKVSVNDFIVKATAAALQRVPAINVNLIKDVVQPLSSIDVAIAVATDSGLITPIVKNVDQLTVEQISSEVKLLASKAKSGKLQPHEFQGGSFTISNLGMFGIAEFSAIISPPQAAILAVGASRLIPTKTGLSQVMTSTLSFDTRLVDESEAAFFLEFLNTYLENPELLMSETRRYRSAAYMGC